jgi:hypothetical protein
LSIPSSKRRITLAVSWTAKKTWICLAVVIGRQVNKTFLGCSPPSNNVFSWRFRMSRQLNLIFQNCRSKRGLQILCLQVFDCKSFAPPKFVLKYLYLESSQTIWTSTIFFLISI